MSEWLDDQEFYEVCQRYRHAQDMLGTGSILPTAAEAFEQLKDYIRQQIAAAPK